MPVLQAFSMERHGHQRPISRERRSQPGIGKRFGGKTPEVLGEVEFAAVFQPMDHVEGARITHGGGPGELEGEFQLAAIRTGKGAIDLPRKWLAAGFTKGFCQSRQVSVAGIAQGASV